MIGSCLEKLQQKYKRSLWKKNIENGLSAEEQETRSTLEVKGRLKKLLNTSVERENCWQTMVRKLKDGIAFFAEHNEHFTQRKESRRQEHTSGTA